MFQGLAERTDGECAKYGAPLLEQTRKMFKLWRQVRDGTLQHRSDRGSRFIERMLSAVDTLRKQDRDVMGFLMDALAAKNTTATPPSLLPNAA